LPERGGPDFLLPRPPSSTTALGSGGLLTLTLRGKAADGLEEQQERTRPQLFHRAWKTGDTDAGFPQAPTGRRRSVVRCSLGLSFSTNERTTSGVRTWEGIDFVHCCRRLSTPPGTSPEIASAVLTQQGIASCQSECVGRSAAKPVGRRAKQGGTGLGLLAARPVTPGFRRGSDALGAAGLDVLRAQRGCAGTSIASGAANAVSVTPVVVR